MCIIKLKSKFIFTIKLKLKFDVYNCKIRIKNYVLHYILSRFVKISYLSTTGAIGIVSQMAF